MSAVVVIEPGTETPAQRIDAIRALALTVAAAEADVHECLAGPDGPGRAGRRELFEKRRLDQVKAEKALALEVLAAEEDGLLMAVSVVLRDADVARTLPIAIGELREG